MSAGEATQSEMCTRGGLHREVSETPNDTWKVREAFREEVDSKS